VSTTAAVKNRLQNNNPDVPGPKYGVR